MRPIPKIAVDFISKHEACVLKAYKDPGSVDGRPYTAGWGHAGADVELGKTYTRVLAILWLKEDLEEAAGLLLKRIGAVVDSLTEHQYAAMLSFVFNLGASPKWTIWKRLKAGEYDQVPLELMKFTYNDGKKMAGLVNRRTAEVVLWSTDEPGSADHTPPSSVTRLTETPPAAADPTPPGKSATLITGALGVAAAVPSAATQLTAQIAPFAQHSETVGRIVAALSVAAAVALVVVFVLNYLKKQQDRR